MGILPQNFKIGLLILINLIKRWLKIIALSLAGIIIFLTIIFKLSLFENPKLSEGIIGTYQEHDLPDSVTHLLSQSLVEADQEGRMTGKLASGWEVNNDATVFKLRLKTGLFWNDGTKLISQDLEFSIPDVVVSYPDDEIIEFKLKDSFSPFPALLTKPVFKKGTLTGVGPYKIIKIQKSRIFITKMILKNIAQEKNFPELVIRFYPNEKTAQLAFEAGEVQALIGISDITQAAKNSLVKLDRRTTYNKIVSVLYNTKDPLLSNRSFRQALSYQAPSIEGEIEARTSIAPVSWAFSEKVNDYLSNPEAAEAALARAKNSSNDEFLKKEIILTSTPQLEAVGQQIISTWKQLGIKAILRVESGIPQNFQALLIAQSIPVDPDQYSLWHSTQDKTNLTKYSSARVDKDLEDGRKILKEDERKNKYADFQKALLEDSPATFLYFPKVNIIYLKKAENNLNKILPFQFPN